jgi:hypothetical protein
MLTIFVDGKLVRVAAGATALDALRELDPARAADVQSGLRVITDSRGLPIPHDTPTFDGAIYRVVRAKAAQAADED